MLEDYKIKVFLTLAEEGSLTAAARRLGVTGPAVGAQLSALEERLGVELFYRSNTGLSLTPSGDVFLGYARRIQDAYDLANRAFNSVFSK